MRTATLFATTVLSFLFCVSARAGPTSSEELLGKCKSQSANYDGGFCAGYITAVLDTLAMWEASDIYGNRTHDEGVRFCLPAEVTNGQIVLLFVKYLEDHSEELDKPPNLLLVEALRKAFPCKQ